MSIHPDGESCSDLGRVLVLNDPPAGVPQMKLQEKVEFLAGACTVPRFQPS
jgi:hypothetical protein